MAIRISRDQVLERLRAAGWGFKKQGAKQEIWKRHGSTQRTNVPRNKHYDEDMVRGVLTRAGLSREEIEEFLTAAVK